MIQGLRFGLMPLALGLAATGAITLNGGGAGAGDAGRAPAGALAQKPAVTAAAPDPPLAERFRLIRAEYNAQQDAASRAIENV
jgi:hypothetical protein